ncbi:hypothetical protein CLOM_g10931 [Closterium sp. NIES-68]|nr:hypothetical protein CLOM_g10931 [Closterium sp. NIES-68]GJP57795.1 hypothetical protein CLOP_g17388 [Closterium sp. NIES-67]
MARLAHHTARHSRFSSNLDRSPPWKFAHGRFGCILLCITSSIADGVHVRSRIHCTVKAHAQAAGAIMN